MCIRVQHSHTGRLVEYYNVTVNDCQLTAVVVLLAQVFNLILAQELRVNDNQLVRVTVLVKNLVMSEVVLEFVPKDKQ